MHFEHARRNGGSHQRVISTGNSPNAKRTIGDRGGFSLAEFLKFDSGTNGYSKNKSENHGTDTPNHRVNIPSPARSVIRSSSPPVTASE